MKARFWKGDTTMPIPAITINLNVTGLVTPEVLERITEAVQQALAEALDEARRMPTDTRRS